MFIGIRVESDALSISLIEVWSCTTFVNLMISENETSTSTIARALWSAAGGETNFLTNLEIIGTGDLPSVFAVSDLATAAIGTAGLATAELIATRIGDSLTVRVDGRLTSIWFGLFVRPRGWPLPPLRDPPADFYYL